MTAEVPSLEAAHVAARQGSYDQAASICGSIIASGAPELAAEARALLREIDRARERPDRPLHLVVMGDSLSVPRPENPKTYDPAAAPALAPVFSDTYPAVLRRSLLAEYAPRDVVITTMCRSSNGMLDVAADAYVGLFYFDPTVVIIHCGVVDLWPRDEAGVSGPRVELGEFGAAFERLLSIRRQYCAAKPLIVVGVAPTDRRWMERLPGIGATIDAYNAVLSRSVDDRTTFVDMRKIVDPDHPEATLHADGIHLNARGHAALATEIAQAIRRLRPYGSFIPSSDRTAGGSTSSS